MKLFLTALLSILSLFSPVLANDKVTLQLKWEHAFQFAGYYAAKELGFYEQAGLNVDIKPALPGTDPMVEVVSGRAEYATGTSSLLLARKMGKPLVVLAVILQHSPFVLIAIEKSSSQSVHFLNDKRLMIEPLAEELLAYLKREGIALDSLKLVAHNFKTDSLMGGSVDAISAYLTNEPYILDKAGIKYQIYTPRSAGIDFYGDNLFTSEQEIEQHPERVKAFRAASLRGWEYAMAHSDEIIQMILRKYANSRNQAQLEFEATQMAELMRADLIAVGYMNPGRWRHIADTYAEIGMLPNGFSLKGFLYDEHPKVDVSWIYRLLGISLSLLVLVGSIALYIHYLNGRLAKALAEVRLTEQRLKVFSTVIEQSPTPVLITSPDRVIEYVNPKFSEETGYAPDEVLGRTPGFLRADDVDESAYVEMWSHLVRGHRWAGELLTKRKSGEQCWEEAHVGPVKDGSGVITHFVAMLLDIHERKQIHQQLAHSAHYDMLTQLPNRILLFERISQALSRAKRNQSKLAILFIDLDKFKPVNDLHGHATGDLLLEESAQRMLGCLRDSDTVGRIGGDEFMVLLPEINSENDARAVAEKIREALKQTFILAEKSLAISSCIGIALFPDHGTNVAELAKNADAAMYQAKALGGDGVSVYVPPLLS
ncbi:GGDEF domain-containing protein [Iodobacter fluviatilis]|uniref:Cyclic di-GMP phosphodiesterase Gmr n=1 Tax=Iodobacter fluviatilis TaxID=537 RepID=A0A377Q2G4_9NEIS|nr:GGDEF domain-containing protein [Iodobacter fluviatilis]TCU90106.1 PAS domain S-box-containing protein/diguanylate cyclase (GGDEF)-like protein [Iodobacter fluviatilis]STQ89133.1 Cyclic di-GMP phosphodiesterase Gmr [Iodobacter fluviatilis]